MAIDVEAIMNSWESRLVENPDLLPRLVSLALHGIDYTDEDARAERTRKRKAKTKKCTQADSSTTA